MKKFKVTVDGQEFTVTVEELAESKSSPAKTGPAGKAAAEVTAKETPPPAAELPAEKEKPAAPAPATGVKRVPAPMPGSIIEVRVKPGDTVKEGDVLLILEAMKMENEITSPYAGTVAEVLVNKGDAVNSGDPLVTIG